MKFQVALISFVLISLIMPSAYSNKNRVKAKGAHGHGQRQCQMHCYEKDTVEATRACWSEHRSCVLKKMEARLTEAEKNGMPPKRKEKLVARIEKGIARHKEAVEAQQALAVEFEKFLARAKVIKETDPKTDAQPGPADDEDSD